MTTATAPDDILRTRLQAVESLILQRRLNDAAQQLNTLVRKNPADARVYLLGCRLAEASGNPAGSIEMARRAVGAAPGWSVALTELAMALARANQFPEAIAAAQQAVQMDPENAGLLSRVIDVAHRAQRPDIALPWVEAALQLAPASARAGLLLWRARDLGALRRHAEAVAAYTELLALEPSSKAARFGRLQAAVAAGELELARQDVTALLADDPDSPELQFWNEVAQGRVPPQQPAGIAQALFDGVAEVWDLHVVGSLRYRLPKQVAERLVEWHPDRQLNVLDLGCGTGLLGVALGPIQGALIGVDISRPMIDQAARHNLYHRFHQVDVREALEATPEGLYDVITALDVFIYMGDLTRAIPDAARILKPGGRLVFSCETAGEDEADLVLRPSMRYAHKASAVEALCRSAGLTEVTIEPMELRQEGGTPLAGHLVVARKPA
ncbi:tetratricopeptide repeat protein [Ramlibacter sp.]|uniref:tetratricopeptide repeat protein n=1 Tax=Ramlibacter sp. TaxID=1917967 RepID=UPI0035AF2DD1